MIAVIDYGMGNLHSVAGALAHVVGPAAGESVRVTDDAAQIRAAERVVLPGVGALGSCMEALTQRGLADTVRQCAADRPFLGICVGMQILLERGEEGGGAQGLGLFAGAVRRFPAGRVDADGKALKIPHMGWNRVRPTRPHPLWAGIAPDAHFYFVHSYYAAPDNPALTAAETQYGLSFTAALAHRNLFATQFHPEKSQQAGLQLLRNFVAWEPIESP